jgi:cyclic pyranopterin phosphate synthase
VATAEAVSAGDAPKGDVLGVARIAGIQAAKRTSELIPLCHPLGLSFVGLEGSVDAPAGVIELVAEARTTGPTVVELEALTAAAVAALTVYDMVKGVERGAEIARPLSCWSGSSLLRRDIASVAKNSLRARSSVSRSSRSTLRSPATTPRCSRTPGAPGNRGARTTFESRRRPGHWPDGHHQDATAFEGLPGVTHRLLS